MYHLQILTPENVFFDDEVEALIAPGTSGYFGILKDHAPFVTSLKEGFFVLTNKEKKKQYYKVFGGFLEVSKNQATLLVNDIQPSEPVDLGEGVL